jgi:uncharacterized glyoxalase superfamily protein PhnB
MKRNRSVPAATVIPVLIYPDVREAVAWLSAAFGFAERLRIGESHRAQLRVGDGAVTGGQDDVGSSHILSLPRLRRSLSIYRDRIAKIDVEARDVGSTVELR